MSTFVKIFSLSLLLTYISFVHSQTKEELPPIRFRFYYSQKLPYLFTILDPNNETTLQTDLYQDRRPTKILCHGHFAPFASYSYDFPQVLKVVYLNQTKTPNVILIDWRAYAILPYNKPNQFVPVVGKAVADLMKGLIRVGKAKVEDFHFIGHSLGAQVGAFISQNLDEGQLIPRVTALDPVIGTPFKALYGLDSSDAKFVDVIHTSSGYGNAKETIPTEQIGTVDFYVNGGVFQRGCENRSVIDDNYCHHLRAYQYYTESVYSTDGFVSYKCSTFKDFKTGCDKSDSALMGEYVSTSISGIYYLETSDSPPFALGISSRTKQKQ